MTNQPQSIEANTDGQRTADSGAGQTVFTGESLREIAERHSVCYEVWPEWSVSGGRAVRVGFSVTLCGVSERGEGQPDLPGSGHAFKTYTTMRRVAELILPKEERSCRFEVEAFDRSWHVAPSVRRGRNETVVTIKILHRRNFHAPIDDCQQQCLSEIRESLARLAIPENTLPRSAN